MANSLTPFFVTVNSHPISFLSFGEPYHPILFWVVNSHPFYRDFAKFWIKYLPTYPLFWPFSLVNSHPIFSFLLNSHPVLLFCGEIFPFFSGVELSSLRLIGANQIAMANSRGLRRLLQSSKLNSLTESQAVKLHFYPLHSQSYEISRPCKQHIPNPQLSEVPCNEKRQLVMCTPQSI